MAEEKKTTEEKKVKTGAAPEAAKTSEKKEGEVKVAKKVKGKKRRIVTEGRVYIQASFNNTLTTVTDSNGEVLSWSSAGANGFKGPKKATPYAAQVTSENAVSKAKVYGLEKVHVFIKGAGNGREQAIRGILAGGVNIESITDVTATAHNGCRPTKARRV